MDFSISYVIIGWTDCQWCWPTLVEPYSYRSTDLFDGALQGFQMDSKIDSRTTISGQIQGDTVGIFLMPIFTRKTGFWSISYLDIFLMVSTGLPNLVTSGLWKTRKNLRLQFQIKSRLTQRGSSCCHYILHRL